MLDIKDIISTHPNCLQSRASLRAILLDIYPGKGREINVILAVYEDGIAKNIKNDGDVSDSRILSYLSQLENDYGIIPRYGIEGIKTWATACGISVTDSFFYLEKEHPKFGDEIHHEERIYKPYIKVNGSTTDYEISSTSEGYEITKFWGFDEETLSIPNDIQGKNIIGIGEGAFQSCKSIRHIIIPEGIKYINDQAFSDCNKLEIIDLPSTLERIGTVVKRPPYGNSFSFRGIISKNGVFHNTSIGSISLPSGLKYLGRGAFSNCPLYKINLPNDILVIEDSAFCGCRDLENVQLPDKLMEIKDAAFSRCEKLKTITFPNSLRSIDEGAFSFCSQITKLHLNEGLISIGNRAFLGCNNLEEILIPSTVAKLGSRIFDISNGIGNTKRNPKLKIYCYSGTQAIGYARREGYSIANAANL